MPVHIAIIEDDEDIAALVAYNLERQGWKCTPVYHGTEGWEHIRRNVPDCVILDMMLPGMNGMEILKNMKEHTSTRNIPVLLLTARSELDVRLEGLRLGADDYITKPFSTKELVLRIRNILHRANNYASQVLLHHEELCLDKMNHRASLNGRDLELTAAEFKILAYLMEHAGKVQDRYDLQHAVLGYSDTTQTRALDTHIKRLRKKLGIYSECIATERGVGYVFRPICIAPDV